VLAERGVALMSGPNPNFKSENEFQTVSNLICSKEYLSKLQKIEMKYGAEVILGIKLSTEFIWNLFKIPRSFRNL
jgi:hypothetical protein